MNLPCVFLYFQSGAFHYPAEPSSAPCGELSNLTPWLGRGPPGGPSSGANNIRRRNPARSLKRSRRSSSGPTGITTLPQSSEPRGAPFSGPTDFRRWRSAPGAGRSPRKRRRPPGRTASGATRLRAAFHAGPLHQLRAHLSSVPAPPARRGRLGETLRRRGSKDHLRSPTPRRPEVSLDGRMSDVL